MSVLKKASTPATRDVMPVYDNTGTRSRASSFHSTNSGFLYYLKAKGKNQFKGKVRRKIQKIRKDMAGTC